jgi:hypothetical protein
MSIAPPRRKSRAVFWISTLAFGSAIAATFLLANDMHHLRRLAGRYHVTWFGHWLFPPPPAAEKPVVALKAKPRPALPRQAEMALPDHALDPVSPALPASFIRTWKISGEDFCARLADAGIPVGEWKPSGFDAGTFECSYETRDGEGSDAASYFIIVRGMADGELSNVRLKVILPDTPAGRDFRQKFVSAATLLVNDSQWPDFQAALVPIGRLENITLSAFGAKLSFSHEFEDVRRFNFVLDLERTTPEQRRTGDYFDRSRWLKPPDFESESDIK